ncbi:cytochrome P450 [Chytriomyces sp. MP71]|nr:cytochrome P450 [Chytriomyces sp. MP71]
MTSAMEETSVTVIAVSVLAAAVVAFAVSALLSREPSDAPPALKEKYWFEQTKRFLNNEYEAMMREGMKEHGAAFSLKLAGKRTYYLNSTAPAVQPIMDDFWKNTDFRKSIYKILNLGLFLTDAEETTERALHAQMLRTTFNASLGEVSGAVARVMSKQLDETLTLSKVVTDPKNFAYTLIANASATSFLGANLAANPEIIHMFKNLFADFQRPSIVRMILPHALKNYARPFLPFKRHHDRLKILVGPTLKERLKNPHVEVEDGFSHLMKRTTDEDELLNLILFLVLASMITTAGALHNVLYDLANNPHCMEEIRREMEQIGVGEDGLFTKKQFGSMPYLDAFVRESLIHSAPVSITPRYVKESFPVTSSLVLPKNSICFVIGVDAHTLEKNADGTTAFNPSRWVPTGESAQQKYSTTSGPDYLIFGGGPYKCPGRFFAVLEIKSAICTILENYDISYPDSVKHVGKMRSIGFTEPALGPDRKQVPLMFAARD